MIRRRVKKVVLVCIALLVLGGLAIIRFDAIGRWQRYQADRQRAEILASINAPDNAVTNVPAAVVVPKPAGAVEKPKPPLPNHVLLKEQFIPQGPLDPGPAHWATHAESCEEAAAIMAHDYAIDRTITMQQAEDEIWALVAWEKKHFGNEHDLSVQEEQAMLEGYYGHSDVRILRDVSVGDLKRELAAGRPIIAPTIAKYLKNPHYRDQDFHMIDVIGYTTNHFITNDNGTTWGGDTPYPYDDLMAAIKATGGDVVVIHK